MLCIIPARGGSKGVPRKNIRLLGGRPLIAHTVGHAKAARNVSRVIVSTDSHEIAEIAQASGAEIPFLRPPGLSGDEAPARDVYLHAVAQLGGAEAVPEFVVLQPTSPLRIPLDVDAAIDVFRMRDADAVVSVARPPHPVEWTLTASDDGILAPLFPSGAATAPRQRYGRSTYVPNGAIFVFATRFIAAAGTYYGARTYLYEMPRERSLDIDDEFDLVVAEALLDRAPQ